MWHENTPDRAAETATPLLRRPRALILSVFALAVLIALLAPLAQLWRASVTPLDAQACVWPRAPLVGQPAQIMVTLPAGSDHAASAWTRAAAEWDMVSMRMGVRRATAAPSSAQRAIAIPLVLDMAGAWTARVVIQAPGRPDWISTLTFTALSQDQAGKTPTPTMVAGCAKPPTQPGVLVGSAP